MSTPFICVCVIKSVLDNIGTLSCERPSDQMVLTGDVSLVVVPGEPTSDGEEVHFGTHFGEPKKSPKLGAGTVESEPQTATPRHIMAFTFVCPSSYFRKKVH